MKQYRTVCRATRPFRNLSRQKQYIMEAAGDEEEIDRAQRSVRGKDTHLSEKAFPPGRMFFHAECTAGSAHVQMALRALPSPGRKEKARHRCRTLLFRGATRI